MVGVASEECNLQAYLLVRIHISPIILGYFFSCDGLTLCVR